MAYIRAKTYTRTDGESTYYYVVQSYRDAGKVRQSTIAYLGEHDTVQGAIKDALYGWLFWTISFPRWEQHRDELNERITPPVTYLDRWEQRHNLVPFRNMKKRIAKAETTIEKLTQRLAEPRVCWGLMIPKR